MSRPDDFAGRVNSGAPAEWATRSAVSGASDTSGTSDALGASAPPAPLAAPAIRTRALAFRYRPDRPIYRGVALSFPAGAVTALLGPNGVGKTTLLNLCMGWLQPNAGSIELFGRPIRAFTRREMGRTVSLVPQNEHIPFEYSLLEYVLLGRAPHLGALEAPGPRDVELALRALHQVGLRARAEEPVIDFSAGEQQLAMFARSVTQEAQLLLMDEPSSHLDLSNKRRMAELLRTHVQNGGSAVVTTHDPEFASACAEHVVLVGRAGIIADGPTDATLTSENLSATFESPVEVHRIGDRLVATW